MKLSTLFLSIILLCSCTQTTTGIWRNSTYNENISHFLMTEDSKKIIFIGRNHHYIFVDDIGLSDIIKMNNVAKFNSHFNNNFYLNSDNEISGDYEVTCECKGADFSKKQWLKEHGFIKKQIDNTVIYVKKSKVTGIRYSSNNLAFDSYEKIDKDYKITVETEKTALGITGRAALTPIAVAEDGIATIGTVGLLVIAAPFAAGHYVVSGELP